MNNMKLKKTIATLMVSAMVFSISACSNNSDEAGAESASVTETTDSSVSEVGEAGSEDGSEEATAVTSTYEEGTAAAELADLYNSGYTMGCSTSDADGNLVVNFTNDDHTDFKQATCTMTEDQIDGYFSIDMMSEDYYQQCFDAMSACDDLAIITPELPDMTEYEAMEGQTIGELEDAGFDFAGSNEDAEGNMVADFYVYPDDDTTYTLRVIPDIAEDDDTFYDDEAIKELTAKEIIFWDFD